MRRDGRTLLTLEERLKLAARSQAVSPETAAKLVQRLSQIHTANFFCGKADLTTMYELIGEFMRIRIRIWISKAIPVSAALFKGRSSGIPSPFAGRAGLRRNSTIHTGLPGAPGRTTLLSFWV